MKSKFFLAVLALVLVVGVALIVGSTRLPAIASNLRQVKYSFQGREQLAVLKPITVDALEGARFIFGQASAPVTVVEFADYQCPACRKYTPQVSGVFDQDRRLRIIYRDTPIFGPNSTIAARLAIASQFQGRHEAFHRALMIERPPLIEPALRHAAAIARVDWPRLLRDLAAHRAQIDRQIAQNENLSEAAGISGTPAFIVGQSLSNGALTRAALLAEIADARRAARKRPRR